MERGLYVASHFLGQAVKAELCHPEVHLANLSELHESC